VGFGDLSNFITTFCREVGWSPSQFRNVSPNARPVSSRAAVDDTNAIALTRAATASGVIGGIPAMASS
jgi:AraC-like DNA-binding protein